jgi:predicted AAA+ superfamily ATPase
MGLTNVVDVRTLNVVDVRAINGLLLRGEVDRPGLFPHLDELAGARFRFEIGFGLDSLPESEGVLLIRGPRQYGKSTWLEARLRETAERYGPGSALYLNGDELRDADALLAALGDLAAAFPRNAPVRRLFVDEITAVRDWQRALKRAIDAGELRGVLVVTTGSKASDLRRGSERLPGRRGKLLRTNFLFTPVSYREFHRVCGDTLGDRALTAYLLSGGCPVACSALAERGGLPEYVVEMIRDWIYGECAASGRPRSALVAVVENLLKWGGTPVGQAKLAREAGLANNTVAAAYVELLADLLCVGQSLAWDPSKEVGLTRRPAKFPFTNLLAAVAWSRERLRSVADFDALPAADQGRWWEWLVAQELFRRAALAGAEFPERMHYWQSTDNEIDFVVDPSRFIDVKRGRTSALEHSWFPKVFPKGTLQVVGSERFDAKAIRGTTMEDFLLEVP